MRFASLGSGSRGNALLIESDGARVLVDCGFSARETTKRLARLSVSPDEIDAVLVTHEHTDHASGVFGFCARFDVPVYMTKGTYRALSRATSRTNTPPLTPCLIDSHSAFRVESLDIQPFPIPHDALEPVQFVVSNRRHRLGILTDTGSVTPHIAGMLAACDALVLECNHDPDMLKRSAYPEPLRRRISGQFGHLSNEQAAALLKRPGSAGGTGETGAAGIAGIRTRLQHVVAAHLSEQNNLPELALDALIAALDGCAAQIGVAHQKDGFSWREIV